MGKLNHEMVKQYIKQIKVSILQGRYATTPTTWKEGDHVLGFSKLYYIVGGTGHIKIDDRNLYPKKGDLIYIPEGCTLSYETDPSDPLTKYWCHILLRLGSGPLSDYMEIPSFISIGDKPWLKNKFEAMLAYHLSQDAFSPMLAQSILLEILYYYIGLFDESDIKLKVSQTNTNLNDLLEYMDAHLHRKITLKELAEIINIHPNYMIHLFKGRFGMPPMDYLNMLRINRAKAMLELESLQIREIAMKCGFSNQYYFSQVFKKYVGVSPTGYRQSL